MAGGSLNLKQVIGGAVIKQGDTNTKLGYELLDKNSGPMYSDIMSEGDNVSVTVVLTEVKKKASIVIDDATIKNGTVIFNMPAETTPGRYDIEMAISVKGQTAVFPSTYASVTLEITKSYLMGDPDDSEVKYVNIRDISNKVDKADLETKLSTKADTTALEPINESVTKLEEDISSKVNKADLETKLSTKADTTSLEPINESITKLEEDLETKLSAKADTTSLEPINESITKLEEDVSSKVNKADFDVAMGSLTSKKDFEDFKTNFDTEKEKFASKDEVVLKEVGKGLSDNNFDNQYKKKLDDLDQTFKDVNDSLDKVKSKQDNHLSDLTSIGAYEVGGNIIKLKPTITGDEVKIGYVEIGKILENDFHEFPFSGETLKIQVKSEADGYVLLYGKPDYDDPEHPELKYVANETEKATRLAVKVDKNINTYLIDFTEVGQGLPGQKFEGNLVITNVTMPEDKASVIREEGL